MPVKVHSDFLAPVMSSLQGYVSRRVFLVLQDGRAIVVRVNTSPECWWNIQNFF